MAHVWLKHFCFSFQWALFRADSELWQRKTPTRRRSEQTIKSLFFSLGIAGSTVKFSLQGRIVFGVGFKDEGRRLK